MRTPNVSARATGGRIDVRHRGVQDGRVGIRVFRRNRPRTLCRADRDARLQAVQPENRIGHGREVLRPCCDQVWVGRHRDLGRDDVGVRGSRAAGGTGRPLRPRHSLRPSRPAMPRGPLSPFGPAGPRGPAGRREAARREIQCQQRAVDDLLGADAVGGMTIGFFPCALVAAAARIAIEAAATPAVTIAALLLMASLLLGRSSTT